jgi:hypothetical protein
MLMQMFAMLGQNSKANNTGLSTQFGRAPNPMGAVARGEYADVYGDLIQRTSAVVPMGSAARGEYSSFIPNMSSGGMNVTVNVAGNVTTEKDLVSAITEQLYVQQKSGKQVLYNSLTV